MQIYLVGGAVRDQLLGLKVKDRDWVVVGATPQQMVEQGFRQVGADFPVFLHPDTGEEYALARTERKQGQGYHGFSVYSSPDVTLEDDLKRRDLTINAMALAEDGQLIDPFNGRRDLEQRRLHHVSEAFSEDPLRILRTSRFAARLSPLGFRVSPETMTLMRSMVANRELEHLAAERVWQETRRALHENDPVVYFEVLRELGALHVLIPELASGQAREAGLEALRCMHQRSGDTAQRLAALLCALPEDDGQARAVALKSPTDCRDMVRLVCRFMSHLGTGGRLTPERVLSLLESADLWRRRERFDALAATLACTLPPAQAPLLELLRAAAGEALLVQPKALVAQGFQGKELGQEIRRQRLRCVARILDASA
ncbi:MAG TPA: multifunctional CCA tRNA nucleotidyl transferase/2'3'-cyclic phosphodiesterase/2'nucleotidase/phosphatase [Marinobacter sp.]|nr:multifunctional CCA tRNA nucleotidyl transferase/2'3'-cyclic phosphodiesterase/2'nucleotidase/phosphatase [Marinobacter sp.]